MQSAVLALYLGGGLIRDLAPNRQPGPGLFVVRVSMLVERNLRDTHDFLPGTLSPRVLVPMDAP